MSDYTPQPIIIREIPGVATIRQVGDQIDVNGRPARVVPASDILANQKHYLRGILRGAMARLESGEVAAVGLAPINGKDAQIMILADGWANGAPERARYATWLAEVMGKKAERQAKERAYDLVNNEGGEGFNPHRTGSERTYARNVSNERDYPEAA